jgi:hypothetical protein
MGFQGFRMRQAASNMRTMLDDLGKYGGSMGGYGSGRWHSHTKAQTVEEALELPATHMRQQFRAVTEGQAPAAGGTLQWRRGAQVVSSIFCLVEPRADELRARLIYTATYPSVAQVEHDDPVDVVWTVPTYGGRRWWWICPLLVSGRPCGRRVGKLYLPPGGGSFGCRRCHELTYTSSQESHKHDGLAKLLGVDLETWRRLERRLHKRATSRH